MCSNYVTCLWLGIHLCLIYAPHTHTPSVGNQLIAWFQTVRHLIAWVNVKISHCTAHTPMQIAGKDRVNVLRALNHGFETRYESLKPCDLFFIFDPLATRNARPPFWEPNIWQCHSEIWGHTVPLQRHRYENAWQRPPDDLVNMVKTLIISTFTLTFTLRRFYQKWPTKSKSRSWQSSTHLSAVMLIHLSKTTTETLGLKPAVDPMNANSPIAGSTRKKQVSHLVPCLKVSTKQHLLVPPPPPWEPDQNMYAHTPEFQQCDFFIILTKWTARIFILIHIYSKRLEFSEFSEFSCMSLRRR